MTKSLSENIAKQIARINLALANIEALTADARGTAPVEKKPVARTQEATFAVGDRVTAPFDDDRYPAVVKAISASGKRAKVTFEDGEVVTVALGDLQKRRGRRPQAA